MTTEEEIAAILAAHQGIAIGGGIVIRPLSMDDFAANGADLAQVGKAIFGGIELVAALAAPSESSAPAALAQEALIDQVIALLTPALPAVQRMLGRCVNRPLTQLPLALAPLLLRKFVQQNFSNLHLQLWVGPLNDLRSMVKTPAASPSPSTSATPGSSSSTTGTGNGGGPADSPGGNSSSGSGAASGASTATTPT